MNLFFLFDYENRALPGLHQGRIALPSGIISYSNLVKAIGYCMIDHHFIYHGNNWPQSRVAFMSGHS